MQGMARKTGIRMQLKRLTRNGVIIAEAVNIHIKHHHQKRRTSRSKIFRDAPQGMAETRSRDGIKIRKAFISATKVNFVKSNP